jgi:hypothetical protein
MTIPVLSKDDTFSVIDPFTEMAKRIEMHTHPDGVVVDIIMGDGAPQTFRVVSVTPASHVTTGLRLPTVEVKPPYISSAR